MKMETLLQSAEDAESLPKIQSHHKVIVLCGSTRFKDEFINTNRTLTLGGKIVLSLAIFSKSEPNTKLNQRDIQTLMKVHEDKITLSDAILVINKNGYMGKGTIQEIDYAQKQGKPIYYLEPLSAK